MNRTLLLSAAFLSASLLSNAQDAKRTYAITGKKTNTFLWADIKQVDITTGKVVKTFFESDKTRFKTTQLEKPAVANQPANPTGFGVAACAFDARHNRLYFSPMHYSEIRYLDLSSSEPEFTTVKTGIVPVDAKNPLVQEDKQFSRMVIGADGYGYAASNDGYHFIRFTTGKKPVVEDLGSLVDAESNKGLSIHNKCSCWGGDMLADAYGKLWIISANKNVFSVDVNTRVATYKGAITGLPATYTTNGAVVDDDGKVVVSSANVFDGLFRVDMKDLKAVKVAGSENQFNASDMANSNLLFAKDPKFNAGNIIRPVDNFSGAKIYPNPVSGNQFNVLFDKQLPGKYTVVVTDITGRLLQSKVVNIAPGGTQVEAIRFSRAMPAGTLMVKVLNDKRQQAFSGKVTVIR